MSQPSRSLGFCSQLLREVAHAAAQYDPVGARVPRAPLPERFHHGPGVFTSHGPFVKEWTGTRLRSLINWEEKRRDGGGKGSALESYKEEKEGGLGLKFSSIKRNQSFSLQASFYYLVYRRC